MTAEERLASLHARMAQLQRKRERRKTAVLGAAFTGMAVCLMLTLFWKTPSKGGPAGLYSGATMLFEDAGGYVMTAAAAFMAGVVITAVIIWKRRQGGNPGGNSAQNPENKEAE